MPELPEVETIARSLRQPAGTAVGQRRAAGLPGRILTGAALTWARTLAAPAAGELSPRLAGQSVQQVGRRGKFLVITLSQDTLLIHLRMSGDLRLENNDGALQTHDRLALYFADGDRLVFNDPRKFGRAWLLADPLPVLGKLGPEPLEAGFDAARLYQRLRARHRRLKPLLLDQTFLAGLGNIYTDEALNLARLHPLRLSDDVSAEAAERLWLAIRTVLEEGIRRNGASIDWVYRGGSFQNTFRVYQRTGQPCPGCGSAVVRTLVGQRGTHYCPVCQE